MYLYVFRLMLVCLLACFIDSSRNVLSELGVSFHNKTYALYPFFGGGEKVVGELIRGRSSGALQ